MRIHPVTPLLALGLALCPLPATAAEWSLLQTLKLPGYVPVFTATTPAGDFVVTTFNSSAGEAREMPVVLVHQPLGPKTQYFVVCKETFDANRGFSGVSVDSEGNYYVAADTGNGATSYVRKFQPNGQPDPAFGSGGKVSTGKRMLGLDLTGDYLFTTAAFAELLVYNRRTGQLTGSVPPAANPPNIRDIAVNPSSQTIYGVAEGSAWIWEGGTFDKPQGYRLRQLSDPVGKPRAGEGIYFDAASQRALMPDSRSGSLLTVGVGQPVRGSKIAEATPDRNSLADAALLQDGTTLLVTDMINNAVYVMKRTAGVESLAAGVAASMPSLSSAVSGAGASAIPSLPSESASAGSSAATAPSIPSPGRDSGVVWVNNYQSAKSAARDQNKPLLLYARAEGVAQCSAVEGGLLKLGEFAESSKTFVCCYFDVASDRQLAQQLGIFKVPVIAIYGPTGDRKAMLSAASLGPATIAELKKLAGATATAP